MASVMDKFFGLDTPEGRLAIKTAQLVLALEKIACRHVTKDPLWWQQEARDALDKYAPDGER